MNTQKTQQKYLKSSTEKIVNLSEGLLITGMHRSGTSMIAGLVKKYGVNQLGKNPMNAGADNRDGFHEDIALVKISDDILQLSDSSWDVPSIAAKSHSQKDNLAESLIQTARKEVFKLRQDIGEPWFMKDPRICLTLNEWRRILLLRIPVIFIVRNPHDVASSLMQRNAMYPRRALALWYRYNSALLRSVDRDQILILDYDLTCSKPGAAQAAVESFLETFLSRGDNSKFETENQVIFNPRNFSRSIDFSDTKLSKESKDCFDLYKKINIFHLKTRLAALKLMAEPTWVEEELNIAQREAFAQRQLEELNNKAEYLFTELGESRDQITARDTELKQLRADTELERSKLETQLEELNNKAEYLFTELGESRDQITARDTELKQLRADTELERSKLETQLEELNNKAEYLFTELGESRDQITARDTELKQLRADTELERSKLETQLEELNNKADFYLVELQCSIDLASKRDTELKQLRADTELERSKLETQLEELNNKADFYLVELQCSIDLASKRDTELKQLRADTELERSKLETQLEELNNKAEYLFTELGESRDQITARDTELKQLRADTELERSKLETQLEELNNKAEYLFTELGESRDQITARDTELKQLRADTELERSKLETQLEELNNKAEYYFVDLETSRTNVAERDTFIAALKRMNRFLEIEHSRLSILLSQSESKLKVLEKVSSDNSILQDSALLLLLDIQRLTSTRRYRLIRKFKLLINKAYVLSENRDFLKNDVLPFEITPEEYLKNVLNLNLHSDKYSELHPDIKVSGINPFSHYMFHGAKEKRNIN